MLSGPYDLEPILEVYLCTLRNCSQWMLSRRVRLVSSTKQIRPHSMHELAADLGMCYASRFI